MDRLAFLLYRGLCRLVSLLPIGIIFRIGTVLGWLAHWLLGPYRRLVVANLTIAFGTEKSPKQIRQLARKHFALMGANFLSGAKLSTMPGEKILRHVQIEGLEVLREAVKNPPGVVFAHGHLGNWEVLAQVSPLVFPCKSGAIYQRLGNPYFDADIRATRARLGLELFERKEGFQNATVFLRQGGAVGVMADQHAGDAGIWCPFFGRLASTTPLPATLALRTGATILNTAVYTEKPGHWRMVIEKPALSATRDVAVLTAELNLAIEKLIRRSPADWFWVHNRWKTPQPNFLLAQYKRGIAYPPGFDPATLKPFPIVVRSSNWLGDAVMTTPAVQAIKRGRPDVRLTVLVKAKLADYWRRIPEVDEVLTLEPSDSVFSVARKLRGRFDVAVVLPNSIRSALEPWLAGVPRRVGYPAQWRRKLLNQPRDISAKKRQQPRPARHQLFHYLELADWLGAEIGTPQPADFFSTIARNALPSGPIKIGLCPGAEYGPAKRWQPERFAQVANAVSAQREVEWVLFGVAGDAAIGEEISGRITGKQTNLIGKTTLAELMDRLSECAVLLTNDTGTMHLAAALGVPTVAIFGSTEPQLTAPLGPGHRILRHQVACSPCFLRECPIDFRCMNAVTAEEAASAVLETLA
ncbi:MAG: lipopolysaccharide heptosyltransferase II [Verrucomicrobia bacterium]|nr:lipopolysaccharide heptosyltransferase II [Verrucomicrobiota bacterium]